MRIALARLPDMRSTNLVGGSRVILNFVKLKQRILFYHYFHYLVGKTLCCANGRKSLYYLQLRVLANMHQAAWLRKNISFFCIRNMIDIDGMLRYLSFFYMNKNTALYK